MRRLEDAPSSAHHNPPILGVLADECLHQLLALGVFEVDDFNAARTEGVFAAGEGRILAPAIIDCQLGIRRILGSSRSQGQGAYMTTRETLYRMHAPVHISHGLRVVYIVDPS